MRSPAPSRNAPLQATPLRVLILTKPGAMPNADMMSAASSARRCVSTATMALTEQCYCLGGMRTRMRGVAFGPPTRAAACAGLQRIREVADCVELRLDLFEEPFDLPTLLRERGDMPVVATQIGRASCRERV